MPTSRPVRLAIELQAADQRLSGGLTDERDERHSFGNWLELLTLLEAARLRSLASDAARPQPQPVHAVPDTAPPDKKGGDQCVASRSS
jgi:hypothetical protein